MPSAMLPRTRRASRLHRALPAIPRRSPAERPELGPRGGAFLGWALVDDTAHDLPYARGMTQRKRLQIGAVVALATIMPVLSFAPATAGPLETRLLRSIGTTTKLP